jgi:hypothetical protein
MTPACQGLGRSNLTGGPPGDFSPERWQSILDGALRLADGWVQQAYLLGWTPEDVIGMHLTHPMSRIDQRGLAWLLDDGSRVIAIDETGTDIETRQGARQRYYRRNG